MGGEELETGMQTTLKKLCCKRGEEKWDSNWNECGASFLFFIKVGEMRACLLMGLNSVERKELMTQERIGISGAMSLRECVCVGVTWDLITAQFEALARSMGSSSKVTGEKVE